MAVPIMLHVQPELIGKAPLKPFNLDLHVSLLPSDPWGNECPVVDQTDRIYSCTYIRTRSRGANTSAPRNSLGCSSLAFIPV